MSIFNQKSTLAKIRLNDFWGFDYFKRFFYETILKLCDILILFALINAGWGRVECEKEAGTAFFGFGMVGKGG